METTDFQFRNDVSFMTLFPLTSTAETWVKNNLQTEPREPWEPVHIEHRYFSDILEGIASDGLTIETTN